MTLVKGPVSAVIDENGNFDFKKDKLEYLKEIKKYSIDKLSKEAQKYNLSNDHRVASLNKSETFQYIKCLISDGFVYNNDGIISDKDRKKLLISLNKVFFRVLAIRNKEKLAIKES
nr:hypothetical protein [uncultured Leptotrichia sp.]